MAQEGRASHLAGKNIASIITIQKVNLNRALKSELIILPGIGPALADRILAYWDEFGTFKTIDDLKNVKGISAKFLGKI
ncbi:MAG TPA: helix-hairpin-helix domain-containing protein [Candidatus Marinimicrobia bacterium]|nr:helix-hairpin-helix domain-containing protein [Candidatus Neomarinimicrobiota bacterium]HIB03597.1 helix-hairpin-helix domain-containing protein [Candidatus Neomarinimicrobiota bacterium]HIB72166.1 helix-hairpin-helix domain-containing protein [Candidatus Neomarinimicrobiota bacterium]HIB95642.1 helix-hairpin-helix domain-containing protein [Candidatus Neomarinimicrobiota bacterium]HIN61290.1 helix-hairpin-helix domain-containing protein [Candidatus Neomarinimicrobiota bacterium]